MSRPLPAWLELREGSSGLILVAPHGGRRRRAVRPGDGTNDLFTAAITHELAERLDACALVNAGMDRNDVDCNRISHLSRRAPELLALLRERIAAHVGPERVPLVVFVHGWNMALPCCDVGAGLVATHAQSTHAQSTHAHRPWAQTSHAQATSGPERAAAPAPTPVHDGREFGPGHAGHGVPQALRGRWPTLARARFESLVPALTEALADHAISVGVGRRYAATGRDNAAQLFSGRHREHADSDVAWIADMAARGRVDGVQLELGIPLRWPGRRRDALVEALVDVLQRAADECGVAPRPRSRDWSLAPVARAAATPASVGWSLATVAADGAGVFAGVEATAEASMAARICFVLGDGRMLLFVGEGPWDGDADSWELEGFGWRRRGDGSHLLEFDGAMIAYAGHDAYADLEHGLSRAVLAEARVSLVWSPADHESAGATGEGDGRGRFGSLEIFAATDAWEHRSVVHAFLDRGSRRASMGASRLRVAALTGPLAGRRVYLDADRVALGAPETAGVSIGVGSAEPMLAAVEALSCVPVYRDLPQGARARWTFGTCGYRSAGGGAGTGVYDRLDLVAEEC